MKHASETFNPEWQRDAGQAPDAPELPRGILFISVVGPLRVSIGGKPIRIRSRKCQALLGYLALHENTQETRERLVGLLWSEFGEDKARASLRQIVHELRETLADAGFAGLRGERLALALDPASLSVDLWEAVRLAEAGSIHPMLLEQTRCTELLLRDIEDVDPAFCNWLRVKRQTVHDRLLRALEHQLRESKGTKTLAEAIVCLDPTHEEACRWVMRARAEAGDVSGALRAYTALWNLLDDEYGMEPASATQLLVAEIKQGRFDPATSPADASRMQAADAASSPASAAATKLALLVGPFGLNGVTPDRVHHVEGFRHHLVACLIRFREWYVIDNAALPTEPDSPQAATTRYSINAIGYQAGNAINLVLTLQELGTNVYAWSERFELTIDNWFESQQRVVRRIAMSLNVQLSAERLTRLSHQHDVALDVYDRWLRGQAIIRRFNPENWNRATQIFTDAIRDAPAFSSAYSSLVQMNNSVHIIHPGIHRDPEKARQTLELARKAVMLDPIDSRAQLCLGWSLAMLGQHGPAAVPMKLACELNPNDSWALISAALFHAFSGDPAEAESLAAQSLEMTLSPSLTHWAYQVSILFLRQDYRGTIEAADRAEDVIRTLPAWRAAALFHLGLHNAAAREAARFLNGIRTSWFGPGQPTDAAIGSWLLHLYPIREPAHWQQLRDGISGAGIPHGDASRPYARPLAFPE